MSSVRGSPERAATAGRIAVSLPEAWERGLAMSVTNTAPARAAVDYLKTGGIVAAVAARDFVRTGLVITAVGMVLLVVFALTYWSWMGYLVKAA